MACNDFGTEWVRARLDPVIRDAVAKEGYRLLPDQERTVVMSTKGASASGKSTMRPLRRRLAAEMGIRWSDFALISPDIWRRALLDFDSLESHFRYAGTFTGQELAIVDHKLDGYMARKGERGVMSHLLIDRFRFDSFAPESDENRRLLARLGRPSLIHYLFMITPPHQTVERAWRRGLETGRFKAVDDLLAHNVEAYAGMRDFFFARALHPTLAVHYEFLDNDVPQGSVPLTAAFGWNGDLNILDVTCMLNLDRYRKINVNAAGPTEVYPEPATMTAERNLDFLLECARRMPSVNFVEPDTARIYLRIERGRLAWADPDGAVFVSKDSDTGVAVRAVAPDAFRSNAPRPPVPCQYLQPERFHTLGRWAAKRPEGLRPNTVLSR